MQRKRPTLLTVVAVAVLLVPAVVPAKQTFVYVHDRQMGGGILGYRMDRRGALTPLAGSPFPLVDEPTAALCRGHCQTMAYSSKRRTLYTGGDTGVSGWTVAKDGSLTLVPGSPFAPGGALDFGGTGVVQLGRRVFVYSASYGAGGIFAWEAGADGSLAVLAGSPFATADGPTGLATRRNLVFLVHDADGTIASYVASNDGTLVPAPGSPVTPAPLDFVYSVDPDARGKTLYVPDSVGAVHAYRVDKKTAQLTPVAGSPFATSTGPKAGAIVTKKLLWVAEFDAFDDALQPFRIDKDGSLEASGIRIGALVSVLTHASDKSGKRIITVGGDGIAVDTIQDRRDGSLENVDSDALSGINPNAVVIVVR